MSAARPQPPDLGDLLSATPKARRERLLEACHQLGFAHVGICQARTSDREAELRAWIDSGRHGEMDWLSERVEAMIDPEHVLPGVRTIICVADRYQGGRDRVPETGPARGRIAAGSWRWKRRRVHPIRVATAAACSISCSRASGRFVVVAHP